MFLWQKNRPFTPKKTNKSVLLFVKLRDVCKNLFTTEIIDSFVNFKLPSFEMDKRNMCAIPLEVLWRPYQLPLHMWIVHADENNSAVLSFVTFMFVYIAQGEANFFNLRLKHLCVAILMKAFIQYCVCVFCVFQSGL